MELHELPVAVRFWCLIVLLLGTGSTSPCRSEPIVLNLTGHQGDGYSLEIEIGTPPQKRSVILDTGSSNFVVLFDRSDSTTYDDLGTTIYLYSGRTSRYVHLGNDKLAISQLQPLTVSVAAIDSWSSTGLGVLGLAYSSIAKPSSAVTPVFDSLFQSGTVSSNMFSMQLCGTIDKGPRCNISTGGKFVVDGIAESLYTGEILYTPIQRTGYYEVALSRVDVAGESLGFDCMEYNTPRTIVASGTAGLTFPSHIYNKLITRIRDYAEARKGAQFSCISDNSDKLFRTSYSSSPYHQYGSTDDQSCCISRSQTDAFFQTFPTIGLALPHSDASNREFVVSVPPQLYLQPAGSYYASRDEDCYQLLISDSWAGAAGTVLGSAVMEGHYVVFDKENQRIGFANSTCAGIDHPAFQTPAVLQPSPASTDHGCVYGVGTPTSAGTVVGIIYAISLAIGTLVAVVAVKLYRRAQRRAPGEAESGRRGAGSGGHRMERVAGAARRGNETPPLHSAAPSTPLAASTGVEDGQETSDSVSLLSDC